MVKFRRCLLLVLGLAISFISLNAQVQPEAYNESYKRMYVFDIGLGFGCPDVWGDGGSSWAVDKNNDNYSFVSSIQLMTYSPRSVFGYGLYYYDYRDGKNKYDGMSTQEVNEKVNLYYVAPQISFIKRRTAFPKGVGYINAGVGYVRYKSNGELMQSVGYSTKSSGVGCNIGIAYEYVFDSRMGIRLAVDCIYARLKNLHKNETAYPDGMSIQPRKQSHLLVPSLELGLSYYLYH